MLFLPRSSEGSGKIEHKPIAELDDIGLTRVDKTPPRRVDVVDISFSSPRFLSREINGNAWVVPAVFPSVFQPSGMKTAIVIREVCASIPFFLSFADTVFVARHRVVVVVGYYSFVAFFQPTSLPPPPLSPRDRRLSRQTIDAHDAFPLVAHIAYVLSS